MAEIVMQTVEPGRAELEQWADKVIGRYPQARQVWRLGTRSMRSMEPDEVDLVVVLRDDCYEFRGRSAYPKDQIEQKIAFDPALQFPGLVVFFMQPDGHLSSWLWGPGDPPDEYVNEPDEQVRYCYLNGGMMGDTTRLYQDVQHSRRLYPRLSLEEEVEYTLDGLWLGKLQEFVRKAVAAMTAEEQREFLAWAKVE
jgi:hypothetical protein